MNNKLLIKYLILIFAPLIFGCRGPVKGGNKNNVPASSLSLHVGDEKYILIDTKESVITWKGSSLIGSNSHTDRSEIEKKLDIFR